MIDNATELTNHLNARYQLVAAANSMLQRMCHSLNALQLKVLAYLISKIGRDDPCSTAYEIDLDELLAILRWTEFRYTSVRNAIQDLTTAKWWISGSNTVHHGFITCTPIHYCSRLMEIRFTDVAALYLFDLRPGSRECPMTIYPLSYILPMTSRYSIRLYEHIRSHANIREWYYEYGTGSDCDIQPILASWRLVDGEHELPTSWQRWAYFRDKVLDPAVDEINLYTDMTITYKACHYDRRGRKTNVVRKIEFVITKKPVAEKLEAERLIDNLYNEYAACWDKRFQKIKQRECSEPKNMPSTDDSAIPTDDGIIEPPQEELTDIPLPWETPVPNAKPPVDDDSDDLFDDENESLFADPQETEREFKRLYGSSKRFSNPDHPDNTHIAKPKGSRFGHNRFPNELPGTDYAILSAEDDYNLPF